MYKLNSLNYPSVTDIEVCKNLSIETLSTNMAFESLKEEFKAKFGFSCLYSFSFSKEGFLGLMLELNASIAVSLGESQAVVEAAKLYESLGFSVTYIELQRAGEIDYKALESLEVSYLFLSPYIIDTFVKTDMKRVKESCSATLISNISATQNAMYCDAVYFDAYKLTGFFTHSVLLHNKLLEEQNLATVDSIGIKLILDALNKKLEPISCKEEFIEVLQETFKEELIFFVNANATLDSVVHFGLKDIKAREIIRNLSLANIYVTNGEGCSLGLSRPSTILQAMGYTELQSRQALSLSFDKNLTTDEILFVVSKLSKSYRQIKALHG